MNTGEQLREMQKAFAEPLMKRIAELEAELAALKAKHNPFHGLWQDAEGTIPVTAAGQPVGRIESPEGGVMLQRFAANRPTVDAGGDVWLKDKTEWMESE